MDRINLDENLLTLAEAAEVLPRLRKGRSVHVSTMYRWISRGLKGIRLEALKIGRTMVTSREALQRFAERLTSPTPQLAPAPIRSARSVDDAERELRRRGV